MARDLATLIFDLGGHVLVNDTGLRAPFMYCTMFEVHRPSRLEDIAHLLCISINQSGDLETFVLLTSERFTG